MAGVDELIGKPPQTTPLMEGGGLVNRVWFRFFVALWRRGSWTPVSFDAADFTAKGSMTWTLQEADQATYAYALNGKTFHVAFVLQNTTVGGVANSELYIQIPADLTAARAMAIPVRIKDAGTWVIGFASVARDGTVITISRVDGSNFTLGVNTTDVLGQIAFEVK